MSDESLVPDFAHLFGVPFELTDEWDLLFVGVVDDGVSHYIVCEFVPVGDSDVVPAEHSLRHVIERFEPPIVPQVLAFDDALDGTLPHRRYMGAPEPEWNVWAARLGVTVVAIEPQ